MPVLGQVVSASVAIEKLVPVELSQQPLVLGPFVHAAAAELVVEAAVVVEDEACLLSILRR